MSNNPDWFGLAIAICLAAGCLLWLTDGLARIDCALGVDAACERLASQYKPASPARPTP